MTQAETLPDVDPEVSSAMIALFRNFGDASFTCGAWNDYDSDEYEVHYRAYRVARRAFLDGISGLERALSEVERERDQLKSAVQWALGEKGEFSATPQDLIDVVARGKQSARVRHVRLYWWRGELRQRAFPAAAVSLEDSTHVV